MSSTEIDLETVRLQWPHPAIAVATLNRPNRYNAMTVRMFRELEALADALDDNDEVRVLVLTGAGKAFCSGYDLDDADELAHLSPMAMLERQEHAARALLAIRT
ncbi:MAG: enoyl-CoA hydratase/isomerase, partial [Pseudonocardiales bacterium]|nr:enoyl-CoA hydratase/isomerase [Pseudonocardiales bacterium]